MNNTQPLICLCVYCNQFQAYWNASSNLNCFAALRFIYFELITPTWIFCDIRNIIQCNLYSTQFNMSILYVKFNHLILYLILFFIIQYDPFVCQSFPCSPLARKKKDHQTTKTIQIKIPKKQDSHIMTTVSEIASNSWNIVQSIRMHP